MKGTEKIRAFVREHAGALGCTVDEIANVTKLKRDYVLTKSGLFARWGAFGRNGNRFTWNADWQPLPRSQGGAAGKGRKLQGFRAAGRAARRRGEADAAVPSMRALVEKHCTDVPPVITPAAHVVTALEAFEQTIEMDSLEPIARAAWKSLREAVVMAGYRG